MDIEVQGFIDPAAEKENTRGALYAGSPSGRALACLKVGLSDIRMWD